MAEQDRTRRSHNFKDHTGQVFGRWTVLSRFHDTKRAPAQWTCQCSCGKIRVVDGYSLRSGLSTSCGCAISERNRARIGVKHHNWKGGRRARHIRDLYGIEQQEYAALLAQQGGVCAICKQPETARRCGILKQLAVDHNHKTGAVRGLLCNKCNTTLGLVRENRHILLAAIEYLDRYAVAEESV